MDWEKRFGATGKVLDVAVTSLFRTTWDCACAFFADSFSKGSGSGACVDISQLGQERNAACAGKRRGENKL
jgi:hypothetical protein